MIDGRLAGDGVAELERACGIGLLLSSSVSVLIVT
jgi:hypothetical protein